MTKLHNIHYIKAEAAAQEEVLFINKDDGLNESNDEVLKSSSSSSSITIILTAISLAAIGGIVVNIFLNKSEDLKQIIKFNLINNLKNYILFDSNFKLIQFNTQTDLKKYILESNKSENSDNLIIRIIIDMISHYYYIKKYSDKYYISLKDVGFNTNLLSDEQLKKIDKYFELISKEYEIKEKKELNTTETQKQLLIIIEDHEMIKKINQLFANMCVNFNIMEKNDDNIYQLTSKKYKNYLMQNFPKLNKIIYNKLDISYLYENIKKKN